jgi:hypothetical protein
MIINKMSILNHFGKVKASYKKYECKLPNYKGFAFDIVCKGIPSVGKLSSYYDNTSGYGCGNIKGTIENVPKIIKVLESKEFGIIHGEHGSNIFNMERRPIGNGHDTQDKSVLISDTYYSSMSPELYVFSFTSLIETFSKCYEKVREKMYSELWKTIECCPFINIIDLLILKQSDTDKHLEHLEEIVNALIDDNKLLQTKINSLESQMHLFKTKIPVAVAVSESTSNSCEKTIAEEILNE